MLNSTCLLSKYMNDWLARWMRLYTVWGSESQECLGSQATLHKTLMVSFFCFRLLAAYNSLTDKHLAGYFNNTRIRRHLLRSGLVRFGLLSACSLVSLSPIIPSLFWFSLWANQWHTRPTPNPIVEKLFPFQSSNLSFWGCFKNRNRGHKDC